MTIEKYFNELTAKLHKLTREERLEALNFYIEYANDANLNTYEEIEATFGSPALLASKIYSSSASSHVKQDKFKDKYHALSLSIMAILTLPLSLPLVIVILAISFSFFISMVAILFSFVMVALSLLIAGFALIFYYSLEFMAPLALASLLKCIGGGLILIAIAIIFTFFIAKLIKAFVYLITYITSKLVKKENQDV